MKTLLLLSLITGTSLAQNVLPALNQRAPELELSQGLQTPGDLVPTLASLHGRLVVLEFWATWCGGCVAAIPRLNETADQVKGKPITFISVTDEDARVVKAFLQKRTMKSWIGVDKNGATFARYGILGRPQTLIIDGDGVLRAATEPEQVNVALLKNALAGRYPMAATLQVPLWLLRTEDTRFMGFLSRRYFTTRKTRSCDTIGLSRRAGLEWIGTMSPQLSPRAGATCEPGCFYKQPPIPFR